MIAMNEYDIMTWDLLWVWHEDCALSQVAASLATPRHAPAGAQGVGEPGVGVDTFRRIS